MVDHVMRGGGLFLGLARGDRDRLLVSLEPVGIDPDLLDGRGLFGDALGERGDIGLEIERTDAEIARKLGSLPHCVCKIHKRAS